MDRRHLPMLLGLLSIVAGLTLLFPQIGQMLTTNAFLGFPLSVIFGLLAIVAGGVVAWKAEIQ